MPPEKLWILRRGNAWHRDRAAAPPGEAETQDGALLACILDMGELLLTSGAEVMRVEDTLTRLCMVYGFAQADVFTITSSIVLTVRTRRGAHLHKRGASARGIRTWAVWNG